MDIKISIVLKDKTYGFSDLLDGRKINDQTKQEIIELIKEDIGYVFDQQIEVEAINYTHCCKSDSEQYCECDKPTLGKSISRCGTCDEWFKPLK